MDTEQIPNKQIVELLATKSNKKSQVFDKMLEIFNDLKELLGEISSDLDEALDQKRELDPKLSKRVKLVYRDRGKFEAELRFADDVLIFSMLPDIYRFEKSHPICKNPNYETNNGSSYCGIITIYNFLYESVKFDRDDDLGYLVARIFINADGNFFVEGKNQIHNDVNSFGVKKIDRETLRQIVENAMLYAISMDLLVTPFKDVKTITLSQMNDKIEHYKMTTGKRLGYDYDIDDILK